MRYVGYSMTSNELLFRVLSEVCDGTYVAYPERHPLPFFVYKREHGGEVYADNYNYSLLPQYRVELLVKENDPELISKFESSLSRLGTWKLYDADWLDSENCIDHDYRLTLLPNREREENGQ